MNNLFVYLLFGHIAGDYLFQSKKMAITKGSKDKMSYVWCLIHSIIYIACIFGFMYVIPLTLNQIFKLVNLPVPLEIINLPFAFYVITFITHFTMDKWSLGQKWLDFIKGRNLLEEFKSNDEYKMIAMIFSAIVYVIVDNGLHLMQMWYTALLCGGIK